MGDALGLGLLSRRSKKAGNEAFQRKDYQEAVRMYCQVRRNNTLSKAPRELPPREDVLLGCVHGTELGGCFASCGIAGTGRTVWPGSISSLPEVTALTREH